MTWTQVYSPVNGSLLASALVAAIPVVVLLGLLALFHVRAHWAALLGLATALAIAILVYGMPAELALAAAGAAFGLLPIGWIIVGAIVVYGVTQFLGSNYFGPSPRASCQALIPATWPRSLPGAFHLLGSSV